MGTDVPQMDGAIISGGGEYVGKVGTPGEVLDAAVVCFMWEDRDVCEIGIKKNPAAQSTLLSFPAIRQSPPQTYPLCFRKPAIKGL